MHMTLGQQLRSIPPLTTRQHLVSTSQSTSAHHPSEDEVNNVSDSEGEEDDERDDVDVEGALTACLTD